MVYDPHCHQGTIARRRRSRHSRTFFARQAPTTSEDKGCRFLLHCLRTSSRHTPSLRTWTHRSFVAYELFGPHVFSVSVFISLFPLGFFVDPPFRAPLKKPTLCRTFILFYVGLLGSWASSEPFTLSAHLGFYKRENDHPPPPPKQTIAVI